ncbi:MAG: copper amine oxidase N-terminal protein [Clostridia bacterium]|jgi:hypothetical protein|nr:copper amine oxidase N-terminal protein [Clostridia bacterium]
MNKKIISMAMTVIVACYPIHSVKAEESFDTGVANETLISKLYIEPDVKNISLRINSPYATINQKKYKLSGSPTVINGKLFVPFTFIQEEVLDANGSFDVKNKRVTLNKHNKKIVLTEGKKTAMINGVLVSIDAPPIIKKGSFLIPFKFICEQFNISYIFNKAANTIQFVVADDLSREVEGNRPTAKFNFEKDVYIAGQAITVNDKSYDSNGDAIIEKEWQIDQDKEHRMAVLDGFLSRPPAGIHNVSLRVKDSKRNWSEWHTQTITIKPNESPVISEIKLSKDSYAQGEKIDIKYEYINEDWEKATEELWSYKYIDPKNTKNEITSGKPTAFFYPGKFVIELQIKDTYGNLSEKKQVTVTVTDHIKQSELDYKFEEGIIGSVVDNFRCFNYADYTLVDDYTVTDTGTKLLMSNSPESVKQKGILYKDAVQGPGRILYHHRNMINNQTENMRFVIIMENKNSFPIQVTKRREGVKGPTQDILYAGAQVLKDFLGREFYEDYTLAKGEKKYLFDTGIKQWNTGDTVSGMIEFYSDEQVHITIAMVGEDTKLKHIEELPILKRDGVHSRGTFENADRYYNLTLDNDKPYKIMLGKPANDMESWMQGYDALTGEKVMDKGNYGMVYRLRLNVKEDTGILLNVRSNIFKGAIGFTGKGSYAMPEMGLVKNTQQALVAGIVTPEKVSELLYVLPNGSAAPVLFCFIPKSLWNKQ